MSLNFVNKHKIHYAEVSYIKLSNDGSKVASSDSAQEILLWDPITKEIITNKFVAHTARIYALDWSSDDSLLISTSLDRSVILWNVKEKSKLKVFSEVDIEVAETVKFINDKEFIVGGHSCAPTKYFI